jgi:hypothetical protein
VQQGLVQDLKQAAALSSDDSALTLLLQHAAGTS